MIKFVIGSDDDYEEAKGVVETLGDINCLAKVAFSPVFDMSKAADFADKFIKDAVESAFLQRVQFSLQMHKVLWPNLLAGEER